MKLYLGSYFAFFTSDRDHWIEMDIPAPVSLTDILIGLGIPLGEVHLVIHNGQLLESTDLLISNRDVVRLYPAISGG